MGSSLQTRQVSRLFHCIYFWWLTAIGNQWGARTWHMPIRLKQSRIFEIFLSLTMKGVPSLILVLHLSSLPKLAFLLPSPSQATNILFLFFPSFILPSRTFPGGSMPSSTILVLCFSIFRWIFLSSSYFLSLCPPSLPCRVSGALKVSGHYQREILEG